MSLRLLSSLLNHQQQQKYRLSFKTMSANHKIPYSSQQSLNCRDRQLLQTMKKKYSPAWMIEMLEQTILIWIIHTLMTMVVLQIILITYPIKWFLICQMNSVIDRHGQLKDLVIAPIQHCDCELMIVYRDFQMVVQFHTCMFEI